MNTIATNTKINYKNIMTTLMVVIIGMLLGTKEKIPMIEFSPIMNWDWIPVISGWMPLIMIGMGVAVVAYLVFFLMGMCGFSGRM